MGFLGRFASLFQRAPTATASQRPDVRSPIVQHPAGHLWELPDRDSAMHTAEQGDFTQVARLCDAMRSDGLIRGLQDTRGGLLSFPVLYDGDPWVEEKLRGRPAEYDPETGAVIVERIPGMWDRMLPRTELRSVHDDGLMAGAGIGYLCDDPTPGGWRRLKHLDLHWVRYHHRDDSWWYQTMDKGLVRITPGDGRWMLFTPYGRSRPWARGAWYPCAGPFIAKQGAAIDRLRWQRFLADGLRYIKAGEQASEAHYPDMVRFMREGWQYAPGLVAPKGYEPGIVEAGGRGYEVYTDTEDRGDREIQVALAGQVVTTDGGKGFSSGDIWRDIASNLIQETADALGEWATAEAIDPWTTAIGLGLGRAQAHIDARDPAQRQAAAEAAKAAAEAVEAIDRVAGTRGQRVKLDPFFRAQGVEVDFENVNGEIIDTQGVEVVEPGAALLPDAASRTAGLLPAALVTAAEDIAPPADDAAARLAEAMTEHGVDRCEHERRNRCLLCGVERERVPVPGVDGKPHGWKIAWRPIKAATPGMV